MTSEIKRSNAPPFWLLFGAGGMLAALVGPMLVFITGIAVPLGMFLPESTLSYSHILAFCRSWIDKTFLFAVISLFSWHAGHRILHSLHDLGVRVGVTAKLICYGLPMLATLIAAYALVKIGFS